MIVKVWELTYCNANGIVCRRYFDSPVGDLNVQMQTLHDEGREMTCREMILPTEPRGLIAWLNARQVSQ